MKNDDCGHECFIIGGPWISEDPDCPVHGSAALAVRKARATLPDDAAWLRQEAAKFLESSRDRRVVSKHTSIETLEGILLWLAEADELEARGLRMREIADRLDLTES